MKHSDIIVTLAIVGIILLIIVPINTFLVDMLLIVNISLSFVILLVSMYTQDALQISVFPSLLLLTTLFRLSLNISTTRNILLNGNKGEVSQVIDGFGQFVIGGNPVVGIIIFLIIVIIQFLVITKGAERVSEVAARFTLDAMPGKQMAIDADLNSGLISESEARDRRKKIQSEADFYGSMDGASKFVKNDAIAGIIITLINITAGFIIGWTGGLSIGQAAELYTRLTIGDGLVSQMPALLISTATGIVVTRAASESSLSNDLISQLFSQPKVMFLVAGILAVLGIFTELPPLPFIVIAILLSFGGIKVNNSLKQSQITQAEIAQDVEIEEIRKPENVVSLLNVDPIELEFGYGIIPLADANQGGDLLDRVVMIRRQCALELGMIVPVIRLRDNIQLSPNQYIIKIKGVEVSEGEIVFNHYMAMNPGTVDEKIDGIETVEPAFGLPAIWVNEGQREHAEMLGYTVVDSPSIIATHLTEIIKTYSNELLGRQEVQTLIDNVKEKSPALVDELVPKILSVGEIQKVLANLLKESVSIRDLTTVFETLADYGAMTRDTDILTEYVRQRLFRAITKKFIGGKSANIISLDGNLEKLIMDSLQQSEQGSFIGLDPATTNKILSNLSKEVQKAISLGYQPIVLTSPIVRLYFKRLTEQVAPGLTVLSYNEIEPSVEIHSVGVVSI